MFSNCLLLVLRNKIDYMSFCPMTLLNSLTILVAFLVYCLAFSIYTVSSSLNKDSLLPFKSFEPFSFPCLPAPTRIFRTVLNGKSGHHRLVPAIPYGVFLGQFEEVLLSSSALSFVVMGVEFCQMLFLHLLTWLLAVSPNSVNMVM